MMDWVYDYFEVITVVLVILGQAGSAGRSALREVAWFRKQLIPGLALSDGYHIAGGMMWLPIVWLWWLVFGEHEKWWAWSIIGLGGTGVAWHLVKQMGPRSKDWDPWWIQIARWIRA